MKRILLTLAVFLTFSIGYAQNGIPQTNDNSKVFKQTAGSNSFELGFDPGTIFNASTPGPLFDLQNGFGVRYRRFNTALSAFRIGVDITFSSSTQITQQADEEFDLLELKDKYSSFGIWLRPGYEKHFNGTKRLSPYIGGELKIGWQTSTLKSESQSAAEIQETILKNGSFDDRFFIGIGALAGLDFYIAQNLFLGLEFNYGIYYFKQLDEKFTNVDDEETITKRGSGFTFSPDAFAIFRIGYLF